VACFGFDYRYASRSVEAIEPIPAALSALKDRCAQVVGVRDCFNQVIVSEYPAGAGIGWHVDSPVFGETIMGLSFGSAARLHLRARGSSRAASSLALAPRSLYVLRQSARTDYEHRVGSVTATRYSLTFREVLAVPALEGIDAQATAQAVIDAHDHQVTPDIGSDRQLHL
jgi:alkylated DNA repair dioxygenase AlkB